MRVDITTPARSTRIGFPLLIGDDVTIAHKVMVACCTVGSRVLIGMVALSWTGGGRGRCDHWRRQPVPPGKRLESGFLYGQRPVKQIRPLCPTRKTPFSPTRGERREAQGSASGRRLRPDLTVLSITQEFSCITSRTVRPRWHLNNRSVRALPRSISLLWQLGSDEPDLTKLEHFIGPAAVAGVHAVL